MVAASATAILIDINLSPFAPPRPSNVAQTSRKTRKRRFALAIFNRVS